MKKSKTESEVIQLSVDLKMQEITAHILGVTPYICNRVSEKARNILLCGGSKKTHAEKAVSVKHDPMAEFRESPYTTSREDSPTLIEMVATAFKKAIGSAALDTPGATKSQITRNVIVPDQRASLWGIPEVMMAVVISGDMARTPDVRTRAILPHWASEIRIRYPHPLFQEKTIAGLLALAGHMRGVGDWRAEKGGNYGLFEIVSPDDERYLKVKAEGGRSAQIAAMQDPGFYDDNETRSLYEMYLETMDARGIVPPSMTAMSNGKGKHEARA